jgi:phosphomannomutase
MKQLTCFKAYDIRGKLGEELNEEIAYHIVRAFTQHLQAKRMVIGGELSAHHYFRDFSYCDSGMIPWLLVSELNRKFRQHTIETCW